jgi:hypothetical protein
MGLKRSVPQGQSLVHTTTESLSPFMMTVDVSLRNKTF